MLKLSYQTKKAFRRLLHPFKCGFWCIMNIGGYYRFGMLWEKWDSYTGDCDYGYSYYWTGNRKTTKQLIKEYLKMVTDAYIRDLKGLNEPTGDADWISVYQE